MSTNNNTNITERVKALDLVWEGAEKIAGDPEKRRANVVTELLVSYSS